jgi:hypothetical protein
MKPKVKPIRDLFFRFIDNTKFKGRIEPQSLALAMERSGLIDLVPHDTRPTIEHYSDQVDFQYLSTSDQSEKVHSIMEAML